MRLFKFLTIFICFVFFCISFTAFAQKKEIQTGDDYYEDFLYSDAIQNYSMALSMVLPEKTELYVLAQLARCHQYSFQYTQSESYYQELVDKASDTKPEYILELAIMQKFNGKYEEAKITFKRYQKLTEHQDPYGSFHLRSINWAIANDSLLKPVYIAATNLDVSGQSLGHALFNEGIIYAHARNKEPYFSMSIFDLDFAFRSDSIHFLENTKYIDSIIFTGNEGFPSVCGQKGKIYFAANTDVSKKIKSRKTAEGKEYILNFNIYEAVLEDGQFVNVKPLPINGKDYNCTHPYISPDDNILYFTSDMPGGIGGYDLYFVKRGKNGEWGEPVNMGKSVNSEEHELYPHVNGNRFYYSSKGLNGYGGYDIYTATLTKFGTASSPQNMGKPYNSFRDDYAFTCYNNGATGYFSSNRASDEGDDLVYYFREYPKSKSQELVQMAKRLDSTNNAETAKRKEEIIAEQTKLEEKIEAPKIQIPPLPITPTAVVAVPIIAETIVPTDSVTSIPKKEEPKPVAETLPVTSIENKKVEPSPPVEEEYVDQDESLLKLVFSNVNFGFNEAKLVPEVLHILDSAATTIRQGNKIKIQIDAHTDSRGTAIYNKDLSLRRATEARNYLLSKGVPASKIVIRGYGEDKLLNDCVDEKECTEEQHAANRRVELRIFK
jgi:outer membrane protein OmpA-like peptidoglycan-associated protein